MYDERVISPRAWLMLFLLVAVTVGFLEQPVKANSAPPAKHYNAPVVPAMKRHGPFLAC
jgi:hypothetical protein